MRLLVVIPLYVSDPRHIEMLRIQSVLGARLRKALGPDADLKIAAVCDYVDNRYWPQVEAISHAFDLFIPPADVLKHAGPDSKWGIRRPTSYAIDVIARMIPECHKVKILRIIQDTFVMDIDQFVRDLQTADLQANEKYIAGHIHRWPTVGHHWLCRQMGFPCHNVAVYVQGAVMMAPLQVWDRYYLGLTAHIHHYWDDVMMSLWLTHEGGQFAEIGLTFEHMHHCDPARARAVYQAHVAELSA